MPRFIKKIEAVKAFQVTHPVSKKLLKAVDRGDIYIDPNGGLAVYTGGVADHSAEVGSWLIVRKDDYLEVMSDARFRAKYDKI